MGSTHVQGDYGTFWRVSAGHCQRPHYVSFDDAMTRARELMRRDPQLLVVIELSKDQKEWTPVAVMPKVKMLVDAAVA